MILLLSNHLRPSESLSIRLTLSFSLLSIQSGRFPRTSLTKFSIYCLALLILCRAYRNMPYNHENAKQYKSGNSSLCNIRGGGEWERHFISCLPLVSRLQIYVFWRVLLLGYLTARVSQIQNICRQRYLLRVVEQMEVTNV